MDRSDASQSDFLSEVLRQVQLSGALFFDVEARPPWVADAPPARDLAPLVMPHSQHVIAYHVVASGACWVALSGEETPPPLLLSSGSVVLFPHGDPHVLSSEPGMRAPFDYAVLDHPRPEDIKPLLLSREGNGPDAARLICGFLGCDRLPYNPLLQSLPKMLVVENGYGARDGWLGSLIRASIAEIGNSRTGGRNVLSRLSELIFIEAVRTYAETLPQGAEGWLAGLRDPSLGRAIALIHGDPAAAWSLARLAREAGVSRTVLAESFKSSLGIPPMTYLANWRMQLASGLLRDPEATLAGVASEVGYQSEAAFSRAFKRCTGLTPSAWRDSGQK